MASARTFNRGMAEDAIFIKEQILNRLKAEGKMKSYQAFKNFKLVLEDIDDKKTGDRKVGFTMFNADGTPT